MINFNLYVFSWIVTDSRFDVLFGILGHVGSKPAINYHQRIGMVDNEAIQTTEDSFRRVSAANNRVKTHKIMVGKGNL